MFCDMHLYQAVEKVVHRVCKLALACRPIDMQWYMCQIEHE